MNKRPLTDKQQRFVEEYLVDLNATQAAIRAGYSTKTADDIGHQLLHHCRVSEEIARAKAERSRRTGVSQDRVIEELAKIAFLKPEDAINFDSATVRDDAPPEVLACIAGCKVKTMVGENGDMTEREVKLCDKLKALDMLAKHLGMYDKQAGGDENETGIVMMPSVMETPPLPELSKEQPEGDSDV